MKLKKSGKKGGDAPAEVFARGFIATGLLAAIQGGKTPGSGMKTLRHAAQGGVALSAGVFAAQALSQRRYGAALAAAAAGAAGIWAAETLLRSPSENHAGIIVAGEAGIGHEVEPEG